MNISGPRCSQIQKGFNASPFSGPNIAGSASAGTNVHSTTNDPEVRSLERLLRAKSKVELRLPGRFVGSTSGFCSFESGWRGCNEIVGENERITELPEVEDCVSASHVTACESDRITGMLEVATVSSAQVTAGASERITGLLEVNTVLATDAFA